MEHIGELLARQRKYTVPAYQRNYSWTEDQVGELWRDLTEAMNEGRPEYFLGAIVLQQVEKDQEYLVIDGQQRLTTILLLLAAIREIYRHYHDQRADDIQATYFGRRDRRTLVMTPNFQMNEVNDTTFRKYVVEPRSISDVRSALSDTTLQQSNRLLLMALVSLWDSLNETLQKIAKGSDFDPDYLIRLEDYLRNNVTVIQLTVSDEADAFTVFETLNDRGLELSILDLLKNRVFGKAGSRLPIARAIWNAMMLNLDNTADVRFLRHHWISRHGLIQAKQLYRKVRDQITDSNRAIEFAEELKESARSYNALSTADHQIWDDYPESTRKAIATLKLLGAVQSYPVLLAALDRMDCEQVDRLCHMMVVMAVRYSLICQFRSNAMEQAYADLAPRIYRGELKKAAAVFREIKSLYPSDDTFRNAFCNREIRNSRIARYILNTVNQYYQGNELGVLSDPSKVNLEHILPKNPSGVWLKEARDSGYEPDEWIHRIGNLALVEKGLNRAGGNGDFATKKSLIYSVSQIATTLQIAQFPKWGPEEISGRQDWLATAAVKVWRYEVD